MRVKDTGYTAEEIKGFAKKYMMELSERFDFIAERGEGIYLYDENGTAYLDFFSGIAVNNAGNCNPKVVAAIQEQAADIIHASNYPYTIPQAVLAKKVCEAIGMDKIYYQNSGTEANEAMIKLARKYGVENFGEGHYHIVTALKGFHGRSLGSLTATGQPGSALHNNFGQLLDGFSYAEFNNLDAFANACTEKTVAIMIELVQGEGGVYPATPEFVHGLRKLCDERNILLLLDEVQTGWGRTGHLMGYMGYGIMPDAISMAKAIGGGMPMGAICASDKVAKAFTPGSHGCTYSGNPVACAAGIAQIEEIISRELSGNARRVGDYFAEKLTQIPHVKAVRHSGLLVGIEFDSDVAGDIKHGCLDRKLLVTAVGKRIIRMVPPLTITEKDCDTALKIINDTVMDVYK